jgi:hypothetical protein
VQHFNFHILAWLANKDKNKQFPLAFERWYKVNGHWLFDDKAEAFKAWKRGQS